ncbi:unnamed protein product [Darwinula stevensoni]|uniref:Uncharacterized protein n=1 Tax=Darwinula stevensoni TaxID=69355 RepID=A0A7R9A5N9_9CRUS|nr:unnamed protein product [Darwinula stevensoni]CAG0892460.1 unnamed protein product [Darwinula stevensoni]
MELIGELLRMTMYSYQVNLKYFSGFLGEFLTAHKIPIEEENEPVISCAQLRLKMPKPSTRRDLCNTTRAMKQADHADSGVIPMLVEFIQGRDKINEHFRESRPRQSSKSVRLFKRVASVRWAKACRKTERFLASDANRLEVVFQWPQMASPEELAFSAQVKLRQERKFDAANLLKDVCILDLSILISYFCPTSPYGSAFFNEADETMEACAGERNPPWHPRSSMNHAVGVGAPGECLP